MAGELAGRPIHICGSEVIHGKTGPPPRGALLFRPFSWAQQEKGQGNRGRYGGAEIGNLDLSPAASRRTYPACLAAGTLS